MTQQFWKYGWVMVILVFSVQLCSQHAPHVTEESENASFAANQVYSSPALPTTLTFAGEPVPLQIPDVAERLDRELLINSYFHSNTLLALKRMQRYMPEIERLLRENDVPEDFIYLALAESLFGQVTSPAGASGFWQLMSDTAKGYGMMVNEEVDERFHVQKATLAACRYLKSAKAKFGSWTNAAASYNRGMGGLERALKQQGVSSYYDLYLNDETSRYMFRILALKEILGNPKSYGFDLNQDHGYAPLPSRQMIINTTIPDLPKFALEQGTNYKTLRLYNPWIKSYSLTVPPGKEFVLELPVEM
ncbi:lytic transglycosylase domain-containing protein [Pontibacter sp. SGAir0037]|uniref:lytic transglycosylase domain-containing protein n=1 Tax=Pontibacter sp. SGAir0037 TaxID=2571030 RepID=UPI0010CCED88|nr:lytic transglycosylase domain-containing protein [Pontibacter sp. SGAir0037]QCR21387.1 murein transglycosylase [Pontibacter sp. SGAir0037]